MTENDSLRRRFWIKAYRMASKCVCDDGTPLCWFQLGEAADNALAEYDKRFKELDETSYEAMQKQDFEEFNQ